MNGQTPYLKLELTQMRNNLVRYIIAIIIGGVTYPFVHEFSHGFVGYVTGAEHIVFGFRTSPMMFFINMQYNGLSAEPSSFLRSLAPYILIMLVSAWLLKFRVEWSNGFMVIPLTVNVTGPFLQPDFQQFVAVNVFTPIILALSLLELTLSLTAILRICGWDFVLRT